MQLPEITALLKAGVHFGHKTSKWHPTMANFIFGERKGVHIIDLKQTLIQLEIAQKFISSIVAKGGVILFVSNKEQASELVKQTAAETDMPYICGKWIGGIITNWPVIKKQIIKLNKGREEQAKGEWVKYTKKEQQQMTSHLEKLDELYHGLAALNKVPDALLVIDCKENKTAIREANLKGIPIIALTDTNVDIRKIDYPVPANDDAVHSLELMINLFKDMIMESKIKKPTN